MTIIRDKESYEIRLLEKLIEIKSVTGNIEGYKKIGDFLLNELSSLGIDVKVHDGGVEAKDGIPRPNIVAEVDFGSNYTLGILTHYDVVDAGGKWSYPPFKLTPVKSRDDLRFYGRGSADDKGCIVAAISAIKDLISSKTKGKWNVILAITADEEIGGKYGAGYLARNNLLDVDALLVADSSSMGLVVGASGIVQGQIKIRGIQGHAGYIAGTDNALQKAITFLSELRHFIGHRSLKQSILRNPPQINIPKLWGRFSLTWIKTPNADEKIYNMIPGEVTVGFDMRLIPEENIDDAVAELLTFVEMTKHKVGIHDIEIDIVKKVNGWITDPENEFVKISHKLLMDVTKRDMPIIGMLGGNDGSWFRDRGIPIISFGVWDEESRIHGVDESVSMSRIIDLKMFIKKLITEADPSKLGI